MTELEAIADRATGAATKALRKHYDLTAENSGVAIAILAAALVPVATLDNGE